MMNEVSMRAAANMDSARETAGAPDWVAFSEVRWDEPRRRMHHLMEGLARRHRVLWINPPESVLRHPSVRTRLAQVRENLWAVDLPGGACGRNFLWPSLVSQWYWRRRLAPLLRTWRVPGRPLVVSVDTPAVFRLGGKLGADIVIYDSEDDWRHLPGNRASLIEYAEAELARRADVVLAVSDACVRRFAALGAKPRSLPNACTPEDWGGVTAGDAAEDMNDVSRPRFLYFGGIDGCIDVEAVRSAAHMLPEASWVFIGPWRDPAAGRALAAVPRCHMFGVRAYAELPRYAAAADALILPFRLSEWSRARDCIKLYEYLATGLPVVTTELPQIRRFPGLLEVAPEEEGPDGFACACRRALQEDRPELRARRRAAASEHTWERRVAELETIVDEHLRAAKGGGRAVAPNTNERAV